jgi:hypothetical protein
MAIFSSSRLGSFRGLSVAILSSITEHCTAAIATGRLIS